MRGSVTVTAGGQQRNKWLVLIVTCLGMFTFTSDASGVNVATPTLSRVFAVPPDTILWLNLAATLVSTGITLTMGRLGDLLDRRRVYLGGLGLFLLGMAVSAVAQDLWSLLAGRLVQAVGGAMILGNALAVVTEVFPPAERGRAVGFTSAAVGVGLMVGGPFGGILLDALDWRALFWTRIPLLAVIIALTVVFFPDAPRRRGRPHLDLAGSALLFVFLTAALLGLNRGSAWGWLSPASLLTFATVPVCLAGIIWVESRVAQPVIALALFRDRLFSAAITSQIVNFAALAAYYFLTPFLLTRGMELSNTHTGLLLLVHPACMVVGSPLSGRLSDRLGSRPLAAAGMLLIALGFVASAELGPGATNADIIWRFVFIGLGSALFQGPNNSAIMGAVPPDRLGTASAMITTSRNIGGAIGTALGAAVYTAQATAHATTAGASIADRNLLPPDSVAAGVRGAYLVAAAIALLGALTSLVRGRAAVGARDALPVAVANGRSDPQDRPS